MQATAGTRLYRDRQWNISKSHSSFVIAVASVGTVVIVIAAVISDATTSVRSNGMPVPPFPVMTIDDGILYHP